MEKTLVIENGNKYYVNENNDIVKLWGDKSEFKRGFIPKEGQKIFVECDKCHKLYEIQLGQGELDEECECGEEVFYDTFELFENTDVWFLYSDEKYADEIYDADLNGCNELVINTSKIVGETYFEDKWDIYDENNYSVNEYASRHTDEYFMINKNDQNTLIHVFNKLPLNRILIVDENKNVFKLKGIKINIELEY